MSAHEDEDGIDGPFDRAMDRAIAEDARRCEPVTRPATRRELDPETCTPEDRQMMIDFTAAARELQRIGADLLADARCFCVPSSAYRTQQVDRARHCLQVIASLR